MGFAYTETQPIITVENPHLHESRLKVLQAYVTTCNKYPDARRFIPDLDTNDLVHIESHCLAAPPGPGVFGRIGLITDTAGNIGGSFERFFRLAEDGREIDLTNEELHAINVAPENPYVQKILSAQPTFRLSLSDRDKHNARKTGKYPLSADEFIKPGESKMTSLRGPK